jgi:oxygen-independent coproporphyrinogen-3 oxidase
LVAQAVETARSVGFSHLNVDLIYGLPRQTVSSFAKTLDDVLAWRPERIACFGYAHVPWMRKHQRAIQEAELPGADARFALFKMAAERVATLGYEWIGYDHFAVQEDPLTAAHRAGAVHRNFMGYTTMPAAHLIGLGTSSIGEVAGRYVQMDAELPSYLTGIDAGILPVVRGHVLSADDVARRKMIMGLMCNLQLPWTDVIDVEDAKARLAVFEADGLVEFGATALRVTEPGRFFLRNICMEFDAYLGSGSNGPRYSRTV